MTSRQPLNRRVHVVSLGCPKNRVDSEVMLGALQQRAWELVDDPEQADAIVVNTCSFIQPATEESIDTILELVRHREDGSCRKLVVTGCMVQRYGLALEGELPEVDHFLGTGDYHRIAAVLDGEQAVRSVVGAPEYLHDERTPRSNSWLRHSAYLKISEGCDHRCAFCIIPRLRGRLRSRTIPSLVTEARRLVDEGAVEINLISQDSTGYGRDLGERSDLGRLIDALCEIDGLRWLRVHYAYPIGLPKSLLQSIAQQEKVVKYLDMPLQHASGPILRAMRRGVTRAGQERILSRIRQYVPDIALRTTFIVGFPGETDDDFAELMDFVAAQRFARVGVFTYCQEDDEASTLPNQVPAEIAEDRKRRLMALQAEISLERHRALVGSTCTVLVDGPSADSPLAFAARLPGQAPEIDGCVYLDESPEDIAAGQFRQVEITRATSHDLLGCVV